MPRRRHRYCHTDVDHCDTSTPSPRPRPNFRAVFRSPPKTTTINIAEINTRERERAYENNIFTRCKTVRNRFVDSLASGDAYRRRRHTKKIGGRSNYYYTVVLRLFFSTFTTEHTHTHARVVLDLTRNALYRSYIPDCSKQRNLRMRRCKTQFSVIFSICFENMVETIVAVSMDE